MAVAARRPRLARSDSSASEPKLRPRAMCDRAGSPPPSADDRGVWRRRSPGAWMRRLPGALRAAGGRTARSPVASAFERCARVLPEYGGAPDHDDLRVARDLGGGTNDVLELLAGHRASAKRPSASSRSLTSRHIRSRVCMSTIPANGETCRRSVATSPGSRRTAMSASSGPSSSSAHALAYLGFMVGDRSHSATRPRGLSSRPGSARIRSAMSAWIARLRRS